MKIIKRDYIDSMGSHVCVINDDGRDVVFLFPTEDELKKLIIERGDTVFWKDVYSTMLKYRQEGKLTEK